MKKCFDCKKDKEFIEFHKNKRMKDGFQGRCIPCRKVYSTTKMKSKISSYKKEYRIANKEHIKEQLNLLL